MSVLHALVVERPRKATGSTLEQGEDMLMTDQRNSLRLALAHWVSKCADVEAERRLFRKTGISRLSVSGQDEFPASVARVSERLAYTGGEECLVIVKRPPARLIPRRGSGELEQEALALAHLSRDKSFGFNIPALLGFASGPVLGGEVLVMSRVSGLHHKEAAWYKDSVIQSLVRAYVQIHLSDDGRFRVTESPIHRISEELFAQLPDCLKGEIAAAGGMPLGLVHGDPQIGNWLWDDAGDVSAVVDWGGAHRGWVAVEVARCGLRLAQQVEVEVGLKFVESYLDVRPLGDAVMAAAHRIAALWPVDVQSFKGPRQHLPTKPNRALRERREAYLRHVI